MIRKYPKQFYDPIRIKIATDQFKHDFRKLFPSLPYNEWTKLDNDIDRWFEGEEFELEPVHDFWNLFGGMTRGLKLKSLLFWTTAANIEWVQEKIKLSEIIITWDFPGMEFMGKAPFSASEASRFLGLKENSQKKRQLQEDSDTRSRKYAPRDQFPVILFHDQTGKTLGDTKGYYVLEGNRRTVKAIVHDKKELVAYVGRFNDLESKWPEDYWFRTGILRDLIFLANWYERENDEKAFKTVRNFYQLLLRDFDNTRIATIDKSFKNFEKSERFLLDLMLEDLK